MNVLRWFARLIAAEFDQAAFQRGYSEGYDDGREHEERITQAEVIEACRDAERDGYGEGYQDGQNAGPFP